MKTYNVSCKETDTEGRGLVTFNNASFAVPFLLDGEKGSICLVYGKNQTGARLCEVTKASPDRVTPVCPLYEQCGGCNLMHAGYAKQLSVKEHAVRLYAQQNKLDADGLICPIVPMDGTPLAYRNKIHATFGYQKKVVLGLYEESTHKLVPVTDCAICNPLAAGILKTLEKYANRYHMSVYNENTGHGLLRHVLIRVAGNGDVMVVPVVAEKMFPEKNKMAAELMKKHPEIKTVVLNYNPAQTTMVLGKQNEVLAGPGYITDTLLGLDFRISPSSFFQVNRVQTEKLYRLALELADIQPDETVVDAYCGTGTISLLAASKQPKAVVTGVELNADAVRDAKKNKEKNKIDNVDFINGDAGEYMLSLAAEKKMLSILLLDPPRSGCSEAFIKAVCKILPNRIVYVSCNPETLMRDLAMLQKEYTIRQICLVDLFPQTSHVESVALLSRTEK